MERNTILAITICLAIWAGWQKLYLEPRMPKHLAVATAPVSPGAPNAASAPAAAGATMGSASGSASTSAVAPQSETLATRTGSARVGNGATILEGWTLQQYRQGMENGAAAVDLASVTHAGSELVLSFDDSSLKYLEGVRGALTRTPRGVTWVYDDQNIHLTREITADESQPWLDVKLAGTFKGRNPSNALVTVSQRSAKDDPEAQDRQVFFFANDSIERVIVKDDVSPKSSAVAARYVGAANRYFALAVLPNGGPEPKAMIQPVAAFHGTAALAYPISAASFAIPLKVYFGPKDLEILRSVDPILDHIVDFGWFTIIAYPILKLLRLFYGFLHNYGFAIILLTVLLKVATYPLTYKSMKSMREMAKLQPQLARIREKFKDDKEAQNRETLTVMRTHGYNPAAGCLPILIQMPVFFALYRVLYGSIELYQAPFALWIHDLSLRDPYYVTPVVLSATMFIQQKLTPNTATDPAQQRMMQFMPLMFGFFMISLPAGLTIYMLTNALTSIVQQMILNKKLGPMNVPAPARAK